MAIKKSEIYSSLWASCDALRGGMDASQYKDYVLVLLFVKYVSDKYAGDPNALIEVPEGGSFTDMVALRGQKDIGEKINIIIAKLAEANDLKGVIDVADFDDPEKLGSGKEMVDRLSNLVGIFNRPELNFKKNRADGDDILGDAYEYLMRHFATESGKSKGQFYTPSEVSRIMAEVIGIRAAKKANQTIYDPTCGSGSLLLKARDEAQADITIYGQEKDVATRALAKMNMVLHDCPTAEVWRDNTLSTPHFKNVDGSLKTFDFVVANPPFSDKAWTTGLNPAEDEFDRFSYGVPPAKNGDYAYLLHVIASLKSTGKGAIILPHGVLFRGNAEADIRKTIVRKGYIKGIIGLPANLFYGTGIPACIVVLDKDNAQARTGIFMIDASKGSIKDGNKNRLRSQDIHKIVDAFTRQQELDGYSRLVPLAEIEKNDFNLNIPRYIDSSDPEDLHDIEAHLKGGIPMRDIDALSDDWAVMPSLRDCLFGAGDRDGYASPQVEAAEVKPTILNHSEFIAYANTVHDVFDAWRNAHRERLKSIKIGDKPRELIVDIAEDLLKRFADVPLIDKYDVYQHLMNYWSEMMQDDAFILVQDGWAAAKQVRELTKNADGKYTEEPDIVLGSGRSAQRLKAELIPPALMIAKFFAAEQAAIDELDAKAEEAARAIEEMDEEHGGEDGLLFDAKTDKGKLTAKSVKDRLKDIKGDKDAVEERAKLQECLALIEAEKAASDAAKQAKAALDLKVIQKYPKLSDEEAKVLVVEDKWLAALDADIESEIDRVSQSLTGRVKLLTERYATPLPQLSEKVDELAAKVDAHLKLMGVRGMSTVALQTEADTFEHCPQDSARDWETLPLSNFGRFQSGNGFPLKFQGRQTGDYPFFKVSDMNNDGNSLFMSNANHWIDEDTRNALGATIIPSGSIVFAKIGAAIFLERKRILSQPSCIDNNMMAFIPNSPNLSQRFFHYTFLRTELGKLVSATALPSLSSRDIGAICYEFPRDDEQRAIAEALSDADALIASLDALIAKKRDLKQAAMQQLLTGKTRLPGFEGEWEDKSLGEIGEISGAGVDKKVREGEQPVRLLNYMDVYRRTFIRSSDLHHAVTAPQNQARRCAVEKGDVFFTPSSETRNDIANSAVAIEDIPDGTYSYHVVRLRIKEDWDLRFRAYAFQTKDFLDQAEIICDGSGTRYVISLGNFRKLTVRAPKLGEQIAIASVLADMDAELAALEAKRDKARSIKQGMMQELLTGRIRLV